MGRFYLLAPTTRLEIDLGSLTIGGGMAVADQLGRSTWRSESASFAAGKPLFLLLPNILRESRSLL